MAELTPDKPKAGESTTLPHMEMNPNQMRNQWYQMQVQSLQGECIRLGSLYEQITAQEAALSNKMRELMAGETAKTQDGRNGPESEAQRQQMAAALSQQLQLLRAEQTNILAALNSAQMAYQGSLWQMYQPQMAPIAAPGQFGTTSANLLAPPPGNLASMGLPNFAAFGHNMMQSPNRPLMFPFQSPMGVAGAPNVFRGPAAAAASSPFLAAGGVLAGRTPSLRVVRQPNATAMQNRILPRVAVRVDDLPAEERMQYSIHVDLVEQKRQVRSEALLGTTIAPIDDDFTASFSRLKIVDPGNTTDVSPAFLLQFQLMRGPALVGAPVRSNAFALISVSSFSNSSAAQGTMAHSRSGPSLASSKGHSSMVRSTASATNLKRKRDNDDSSEDQASWETSSEREMPVSYGGNSVIGGLVSAASRFKRVKSEPNMKSVAISTHNGAPDSPDDSSGSPPGLPTPLTPSGRDTGSQYVDITDLLSLPQKDAAARLGISESMLCKRFKECTRRKWPYRYLRKVEKQIAQLHEHRNTIGYLTVEENNRLEGLLQEREDCLAPVRIRVTSHDISAGSPVAARSFANNLGVPPSPAAGGEMVPSFSGSSIASEGRSGSVRSQSDTDAMVVDEEPPQDSDMDVSTTASKTTGAAGEEEDDDWTSVAKTLETLRAMGGSRGPTQSHSSMPSF